MPSLEEIETQLQGPGYGLTECTALATLSSPRSDER